MERTQTAADNLSVPARSEFIAGRVTALLSNYYVAEIPDQIAESVARDWIKELEPYPAWAIDNACRWWGSRENKKRGKKPIWGDIGERCELEMGIVRLAEAQIRFYRKHGDNPPDFLKP